MVSLADKLKIYEAEFDAIEKDFEVKGPNKENSRRFLVFTEAFLFAILQAKKGELNEEVKEILNRLKSKAARHQHINMERLLGD